MNAELREEIRTKIEGAKASAAAHGCHWGRSFFINFPTRLPGGYGREWPDFDRVYGHGENFSDLARSQTYGEFYATIDKIIEAAGMTVEDVRLNNVKFNEGVRLGRLSAEEEERFYNSIMPIYEKLREAGYNHYPDLTV